MSTAQRKTADIEDTRVRVETWLRQHVVPAYEAWKENPDRGRTPQQVEERLRREIARRR